jgi:hypothetical protein
MAVVVVAFSPQVPSVFRFRCQVMFSPFPEVFVPVGGVAYLRFSAPPFGKSLQQQQQQQQQRKRRSALDCG